MKRSVVVRASLQLDYPESNLERARFFIRWGRVTCSSTKNPDPSSTPGHRRRHRRQLSSMFAKMSSVSSSQVEREGVGDNDDAPASPGAVSATSGRFTAPSDSDAEDTYQDAVEELAEDPAAATRQEGPFDFITNACAQSRKNGKGGLSCLVS